MKSTKAIKPHTVNSLTNRQPSSFGPRPFQTRHDKAEKEDIPNKTGLPDKLKAGVERLSRLSLDRVKVHYNSPKPAELGALAYTQGNEIHVGPGNEAHLPHEAWHVVQQRQGRVRPTMQLKGASINDSSHLETEAERMGAKVVADNRLSQPLTRINKGQPSCGCAACSGALSQRELEQPESKLQATHSQKTIQMVRCKKCDYRHAVAGNKFCSECEDLLESEDEESSSTSPPLSRKSSAVKRPRTFEEVPPYQGQGDYEDKKLTKEKQPKYRGDDKSPEARLARERERAIKRKKDDKFPPHGAYNVKATGKPIHLSRQNRQILTHTKKDNYGGKTLGKLPTVQSIRDNFPEEGMPALFDPTFTTPDRFSDIEQMAVGQAAGQTIISDDFKIPGAAKLTRAMARRRDREGEDAPHPLDPDFNVAMRKKVKNDPKKPGGAVEGRRLTAGLDAMPSHIKDLYEEGYVSDSSEEDNEPTGFELFKPAAPLPKKKRSGKRGRR